MLGRTLALGMDLLGTGTGIRSNPQLADELTQLKQSASVLQPTIEWREWAHVQALDRFAHADMTGAAQVWEDILARHPTDMHALKFAHDTYFYLGARPQMLGSVERVLPAWRESLPLSEYLRGMHAFGLEETQQYARADTAARAGLHRQPHDAWATHALAHVFEMTKQTAGGLAFLSGTVADWERCNLLACHNFWHWALFHIEHDEPEGALALLESEILRRAKGSGAMLDVVDAASLLYRLELLHPRQFTQPAMWSDMADAVEFHFDDNILGFNQLHFGMLCLGAERERDAEGLLESLRQVEGDVTDQWPAVARTLLQAMLDFKREQYAQAVEKMLAVREQVYRVGGSDAQRDLFNQLLIVAAIRARDTPLCRQLIVERHQAKGSDDLPVRRLKEFVQSQPQQP